MRKDLTSEALKKYFTYDPETGEFKRVVRRDRWGNIYHVNELVTSSNNRGYFWVSVFGYMHLVHRLAFLYMTDRHPSDELDHIDGNRMNNKWCNLREVTPFENSRNQGNRKDNTTGFRGVTYRQTGKGLKRWKARISHMGVRYELGEYLTKEEAVDARRVAEAEFKYHPNHARRESWRG